MNIPFYYSRKCTCNRIKSLEFLNTFIVNVTILFVIKQLYYYLTAEGIYLLL